MRLVAIEFFVLFLCGALVQAQSEPTVAQKFESKSHTFQNTTLPYRIFVPDNYDPEKSYPLLLCLHGAGERGTDNKIQISKHNLAISWAQPEVKAKHPSIIVAPQCPKKRKWAYTDFGQGSYAIDTIPMGKEMQVVVDLMDVLLDEFSIDVNRQYITGLSMGGYGTWDMITRYPKRFAAAAPMSGAGDPTKAALFKALPIWNFHNTNDKIVPVSGSREMAQAMKESGIKVLETQHMSAKKIKKKLHKKQLHLYTESPEGNHGPWEPWYADPRLHDWLFAQTK